MKLTLDHNTVRELATPSGDSPLVVAVYLAQYRRQVAQLRAIETQIGAEAPDVIDRSGFNRSLQQLASATALVQRRIVSHPGVGAWITVARDLLRRSAHIRLPDFHVRTHLEDFARFSAAAACLDVRLAFDGALRTTEDGRIVLSGAGIYLEGSPRIAHRPIAVRVEHGTVTAVAMRVKGMTVTSDGLEVDAVDTGLHRVGGESFAYADWTAGADRKWLAVLDEAILLAGRAVPAFGREYRLGMHVVLPVMTARPDTHASATFREAPGLTALSWTSDVGVLAEALVHEYHHQKLNALLTLDPLIAGPTREARFLSPWRQDPRPLLGLLHGAFSFHAVALFWTGVLRAGVPLLHLRRAEQRLHLVWMQTRDALDTLFRHAQWTGIGRGLVAALHDSVAALHAQLPAVDARHLEALRSNMRTHRESWTATNGDPDAAVLVPPAKTATAAEAAVADALGLDTIDVAPTDDIWHDQVLRALMQVRDREAIEKVLRAQDTGSSNLLSLVDAHLHYLAGRFGESREAYVRFGGLAGSCDYARICAFFCDRHLYEWADAEYAVQRFGTTGHEPASSVRR
jgi:HEXXH motif-containing protein